MEKTFGFYFFIRKAVSRKRAGLHDIYLRITVNGEVSEMNTKRNCAPNMWDPRADRVAGKTDGAKSINGYLEVLEKKIYEHRKTLVDTDQPVTALNIKLMLNGLPINQPIKKPKHMIMTIFRQHNDEIKALVGSEYSENTLERYEVSYRHTLNFLLHKYKAPDMEINDLNYEFMAAYEFWLKTVRKCDHNSTMKYLANFKKIVIRCIKYGLLTRDPFVAFKLTKREVERIALTESEITRITNETFEIAGTAIVRDIFLFSCYTGLAYADVEKLRRTDIVIGNDGEQWLISRRQKTDITARIPLLPPALAIITKYINHPRCTAKSMVLPVPSNQKVNEYLKIVANKCDITKTLTFHIARHTFATTVTLSNGVPIETVSKMLGHRNLKTTQHYAKILDKKIGDDMRGLREKYRS